MKLGELAAAQVRLILERQCSDVGREIHAALDGEGSFVLFFADLGEAGDVAFFSDAELVDTVAMLRRWRDAGGILPAIAVSAEEGADAVDGMRDLGKKLTRAIPAGVGFALLLWDGETPLAYVSNIYREDVQKLVGEWLGRAAAGAGAA